MVSQFKITSLLTMSLMVSTMASSASVRLSDPSNCYPLLHASSSPENTLDTSRYFYFIDSMSNSYYSTVNITNYNGLPTVVRYGFVTLSCQCQLRGERRDCCTGNKARLDSTGSNPEGPPPTDEQRIFLDDVCTVAAGSIGDNIMPPTGELPGSDMARVTGVPTVSPVGSVPSLKDPVGEGRSEEMPEATGGLGGGAWAGIAVAGAAILSMLVYLLVGRTKREEEDDPPMDDVGDVEKERHSASELENGESPVLPPSPTSTTDVTQSLTVDASDVSSIPSIIGGNASRGDGGTNLLPGRSDEESVLSREEDNYFYNNAMMGMGGSNGDMVGVGIGRMGAHSSGDDESSISSKSHTSSVLIEDALHHPEPKLALPPQRYTPGELDQAIENGNWEAVAASAAAIVSQSEGVV